MSEPEWIDRCAAGSRRDGAPPAALRPLMKYIIAPMAQSPQDRRTASRR